MGWHYGVERRFQQYCSYIVAVSFIDKSKPEYSEKTTDLPQAAICQDID